MLDNACKWGRTKVLVTVRTLDAQLEISVEDDGPGRIDARAEALFRRGARLDERVPGSGLGLAIPRDLAEIYGGTVHLQLSALGALAAILILPRT
jgi:signal transduction histidine kinase